MYMIASRSFRNNSFFYRPDGRTTSIHCNICHGCLTQVSTPPGTCISQHCQFLTIRITAISTWVPLIIIYSNNSLLSSRCSMFNTNQTKSQSQASTATDLSMLIQNKQIASWKCERKEKNVKTILDSKITIVYP